MKRILKFFGSFTFVNVTSGAIKYGLFNLILPLVGPDWANLITALITTPYQYIGFRKLTWRERASANSFLKFLILEIPVTLVEILFYRSWRLIPFWDEIHKTLGIESEATKVNFALYTFGILLWVIGLLYHNFVTFREKTPKRIVEETALVD